MQAAQKANAPSTRRPAHHGRAAARSIGGGGGRAHAQAALGRQGAAAGAARAARPGARRHVLVRAVTGSAGATQQGGGGARGPCGVRQLKGWVAMGARNLMLPALPLVSPAYPGSITQQPTP